MSNVVLQIPVDKQLRDSSLAAAKEMGFSSLQELLRVIMKQLSAKQLSVAVTSEQFPAVKLSKKNDARYSKMIEDIESGKEKTESFDNVDDMFAYLNS